MTALSRAARSLTAPVRDYVNNHFEMVKQEIRDLKTTGVTPSGASPPPGAAGTDVGAWDRLAELEALIAEQAHHQAAVVARLGEQVGALTDRIGELEVVVRQLAAVVAAESPDRDPGGDL